MTDILGQETDLIEDTSSDFLQNLGDRFRRDQKYDEEGTPNQLAAKALGSLTGILGITPTHHDLGMTGKSENYTTGPEFVVTRG